MKRRITGLLGLLATAMGIQAPSPATFNGVPSAQATSSPNVTKGAQLSPSKAQGAEQRAMVRVFGSGRYRYSDGVIPPFHRVKGKTRAALRPSR